jgi:hypothetical protein
VRRAAIVTIAVAFGAAIALLASAACLVTVDESLVDKARTNGPNSPDAAVEGGVTEAGSADAGGVDAGSVDAASEASVYAGMPCGTQRCFPSTGQVCCTGSNGDPDPSHGSCGKSADCRTGDFFGCMGPADCADATGQPPVCCASDFSGGGFSHSSCKTACTGTDVELCDPARSVCPSPRVCVASTEYVGLHACQ